MSNFHIHSALLYPCFTNFLQLHNKRQPMSLMLTAYSVDFENAV